MNFEGWGPQRWAIHFSQMLNLANPPNRYRFDVGQLAVETSRAMFPGDPITKVEEEDLDGFAGSLYPPTPAPDGVLPSAEDNRAEGAGSRSRMNSVTSCFTAENIRTASIRARLPSMAGRSSRSSVKRTSSHLGF